jgi:membrane protein DedA with SNARE-associated domain
MADTVSIAALDETSHAWRRGLIGTAALRGLVSVAAVFLAPALYRDHVAILTLMRPTKEVFLYDGFVVRRGDAFLPVLVASALPILLLGVWIFFGLGRAYGQQLCEGELPGIAGRILPKKRIDALREVLDDRGTSMVFLGRLAAFPSSLLAAAAGSSGMPWAPFLLADTLGALTSMAALLSAGYLLGEAYEDAGAWVTVVGVAVLVALLVLFGRELKKPRWSHRRQR